MRLGESGGLLLGAVMTAVFAVWGVLFGIASGLWIAWVIAVISAATCVGCVMWRRRVRSGR